MEHLRGPSKGYLHPSNVYYPKFRDNTYPYGTIEYYNRRNYITVKMRMEREEFLARRHAGVELIRYNRKWAKKINEVFDDYIESDIGRSVTWLERQCQ